MRLSFRLGGSLFLLAVVGPGVVSSARADTCPGTNLGSATGNSVASGTTAGTTNTYSGTCGGSGAPERTYLWTAPSAGTWVFDNIGSNLDTIMYIRDGGCSGTELGCNDAINQAVYGWGPAGLTLTLSQGQTVAIFVDGYYSGVTDSFVLNINQQGSGCTSTDLGTATGASVASSTTSGTSAYSGTCGGSSAPEKIYKWTAPSTGTFVFDTFGSSFDTILHIKNTTCTGTELGCNDQANGTNQSSVTLSLTSGQVIYIFVDGYSTSSGSFVLNINLQGGGCTATDLGTATGAPVASNTTSGTSAYSGTCGGSSAPEKVYKWTAPSTGTFVFDTFGSTFDTVLHIKNTTCTGTELGCNDQSGGNQSSLTLTLTSGQVIYIFVDGYSSYSGWFQLNIALSCTSTNLGSAVGSSVASGSTSGTSNYSGTCASAATNSSPERIYKWTAPYAGTFTFDTYGSSLDTVLYIRNTSCSGTQLGCNDQSGGTNQSLLSLTVTSGQVIYIFVDGYYSSGSFQLNITAPPTCPNTDLGSSMGSNVVTGTTSGSSLYYGSCGSSSAPEKSYKWTAPSTGSFVIDTVGSSLDTLLYVRNTSCTGTELDCNDYFDTATYGYGPSRLTLSLTSGQVIYIFVDGYGSEYGNFQLNIALAGPACPETNLGSATGNSVRTGTTVGGSSNYNGGCGGSSTLERTFTWTAPSTGLFKIDTTGSSINTAIYVRSGTCTGTEVACGAYGTSSSVRFYATTGSTYIIVVDGVGGVSGNYVLNINPSTPQTFFVSSSAGSDSNPGSLAAPWLTITKALASAYAGDTVYFVPGTYSAPSTYPSQSGTSGNLISFIGDTTCANSTGIAGGCTPGAVNVSAGSTYTIRLSGNSYIYLKGFTISIPTGFANAGVRLESGAANNTIRENTFVGTGSDSVRAFSVSGASTTSNTISNNTINLTATTGGSIGIYVDSSAGTNTFSDNSINCTGTTGANYGFYFTNAGSSNVIQSNTITGSARPVRIGYTSGTTITGNTISGYRTLGIDLYSASSTTVTSNTLTAASGSSAGIKATNTSSSNTISQNDVTITGNDGISAYSGCNSNTVSGNTVRKTSGGPGVTTYAMYFASTSNTVTQNRIEMTSSGDDYGILINAGQNTLDQNTIVMSGTGTKYAVNAIGSSALTFTDTAIELSGATQWAYGFALSSCDQFSATRTTILDPYLGVSFGSSTGVAFNETTITGATNRAMDFRTVRQLSVNGCTLTGTASALYGILIADNGTQVGSGDAAVVSGCDSTGGQYAGLSINQDYVTVRASKFHGGYDGAWILGRGNIVLDGVEIYSNTPGMGISVEQPVTGLTIKNSDIHDNGYYGVGIGVYATSTAMTAPFVIKDSRIRRNAWAGIATRRSSNLTITGNVIEGNNTANANGTISWCRAGSSGTTTRKAGGIFFHGDTRNTSACSGTGVGFTNSSVIAQNTIRDNTGIGIWLYGGQSNTFQGNLITGNSGDGLVVESEPQFTGTVGAWYRDASGNSIDQNVIAGNTGAGVVLRYASSNTVVNNIIAANGGNGIEKLSSAYSWANERATMFATGEVNNNLVYSNAGSGLVVEKGSGGTVRSNTFYRNGVTNTVASGLTRDQSATCSTNCCDQMSSSCAGYTVAPDNTLTLRNNSFVAQSGFVPAAMNHLSPTAFTWTCDNNHFYDFSTTYSGGACPSPSNDLTADPVFVTPVAGADGVLGWSVAAPLAFMDDDFHLSHIAAGQATSSQLIDRGLNTAAAEGQSAASTRTDGVVDTGTADIGFHYAGTAAGTGEFNLTLADFPTGQSGCCSNAFSSTASSVMNAELLGFQVTNNSTGYLWMKPKFRITNRIGLNASSWSGITITRDDSVAGAASAWTNTTSLPATRYGQASLAYNGYLYFVGGYTGIYKNDVQFARINDNGTIGTWTTTTPFSTGRYALAAVAHNGYLYILGGDIGGSHVADVWFAPINANGTIGAWTATSSFSTSRKYHQVFVYGDYMYLVGGYTGSAYLDDVQYARVNPNGTLGSWTTASAPIPNLRYDHTAVAHNGYIYVIGGGYTAVHYAPINADGTLGAWNTTTPFPDTRYGHTSVVYGGYLYVFGGNVSGSPSSSVYSAPFNPDGTLGSWTATTSFATGRYVHSSALHNGFAYVLGGTIAADSGISSVQYAALNANGAIDPSETTTVGGLGVLTVDNETSRSTGTIDFDTAVAVPPGVSRYILRASFPNLNPLEQATISLSTADTAVGFGATFTAAATVTSATHAYRSVTGTSGTVGTYYSDTNFSTMQSQRLDSTIDLAYTNPAPSADAYLVTGLPSAWSARWYGAFYAPCDGDFTIYADPEGKVKLATDWSVDFDTSETTVERSATMRDIKTGWHPFALSYVESGSGASQLQLKWSATCGGITYQVIPTSRLATIPQLGGGTAAPTATYSCSAGNATAGYEMTDRSIATSFTSNALTTATLYYRTSPSGSWQTVADAIPRLTHTVATSPTLTASTAYDFFTVITDANGNSTTLTTCTASTSAAQPWCRGGPAIRQSFTLGAVDEYLLTAPSFARGPSYFFGFADDGRSTDNFVTRIGYDYAAGVGTKTALHQPTTNACSYYVFHDDGVYVTTGATPTVIADVAVAGSTSMSFPSTLGFLEVMFRQTQATVMARFEVKEQCAWRGDVTPQPIPASRWFVTCDLADTTGPIITGTSIEALNATGARIQADLSEKGFGKVDYGTSPGSLTMCAGHCEGASALTPQRPSEFAATVEVGLHNLAPSTQYYYRATAWDLRGNTTVGSVEPLLTPAAPTVTAGGVRGTYYSDMVASSTVATQIDSTINMNEGVAGWPPSPTPSDSYSVDWTGFVLIPDACDQSDVTFIVTAEDGVGLVLDDLFVLMDWSVTVPPAERRVTRRFSRGWHDIGIVMFSYAGSGSIVVEWEASGCGLTRTVVPASAWGTSGAPGDTTKPTISKTCLTAPLGHACTGTHELTVDAGPSCTSPASMAAPTPEYSDTSTPVVPCWRPISASSCAGNLGWPADIPLGSTVVPFLAVDSQGNAADAGVTVRVLDQTAPSAPTVTLLPTIVVDAGTPRVLANPSGCDLTIQATSGSVTIAPANYFDAGATDNCSVYPGGGLTIAAPGSTPIPLGSSAAANWTALDNAGNTSSATSKTICARDFIPPTITLPPITTTAECSGRETCATLPTPTVADDNDLTPTWRWEYPDGGAMPNCDGGTMANFERTARLPYGSWLVRVRAEDTFGNAATSATHTVSIQDTVSPTIALRTISPALSSTPVGMTSNADNVITTWDVADTCSGTTSPSLAVAHSGSGAGTFDDAGGYMVTTSAEGSHTITVSVTDQAARSANASTSFILDRARPILSTSQGLSSADPARPTWFFYGPLEQPATWAAADESDAGASTGLALVQVDVWKDGVAAPDAGQNLLVRQTSSIASSGDMCEILTPGSICTTDALLGDRWDFRKLGTIGDYQIYVTVQDLAGNFALGSDRVDGGPREARKYEIKVARLAQAIDETVSITTALGSFGTTSFRAHMATAKNYAENMQKAWSHEIGVLRAASGDPPASTIFAADWGYSWDAGDRPWESLPAGARRTLLLDQAKLDPRQGLRGRMMATALEQMGSYYTTIEAAINDPSAGATADQKTQLRWTKWALGKGAIAESILYVEHLEDAGWSRQTYSRWGDYGDRANTIASTASNLLYAADAGADFTNAWTQLWNMNNVAMKAEYDYDVPFSLTQFGTHPTTGKKRLPAQIAVEANPTKGIAIWKRLASEARALAAIDASVPPGTVEARRFIGEAAPDSGLVEQHWPPLKRSGISGEPYAWTPGAQYTAASAGSSFDGVVPASMLRDGGTGAYVPFGSDAGQYMRFKSIDAIWKAIGAFRFCRKVNNDTAGCEVGEECVMFDPERKLTASGYIPNGCDPNGGTGGMLHGYVPALIDDGDGGFVVNPENQSANGTDYWNCPANGWCAGPWDGGLYRPSPVQYTGALFAMTQAMEQIVNQQAAGAGASTALEGLVFGLTERIFAISAPATALTCPSSATTISGTCVLDDAGAEALASACASEANPGRCVRMGEMRNTLRSEWGAALKYVAACYDSTIADCPSDGGTGNCTCTSESPVPACAEGVTDISNCCVEACDPVMAYAKIANNMCNFQHVTNLAFQYPISGSAASYYRVPQFSGFAGCAPTVGNEPLPPSGLAASGGANQVALTWYAPVGGATSYNIYRSTATGVTRFTGADAGTSTSTNFTNTGLSNGTTYYYVVTAVNDAGESTESFEANETPSAPSTDWTSVTVGYQHACATKDAGTIWCWGLNYYATLGDGTTEDKFAPTYVDAGANWASVRAGTLHSCGLKGDGTIWCWGYGGHGAIGDQTWVQKTTPTYVDAGIWASVAAGVSHTCGLKSDGALWCWGWNNLGQLGDGTTTNRNVPTYVDAGLWARVGTGDYVTCGLRGDETLWCWGSNTNGQLGDGTTEDKWIPTFVDAGANWASGAAGRSHTCWTKTDGTLWCWGYNASGQLGDGTTADKWVPTLVDAGTAWASVDVGLWHTCGIKGDGTMWCWGWNHYGSLGDGTTAGKLVPTFVDAGATWVSVGAGYGATCGMKSDGTIWCWGYNADGQLGDGTAILRTTPTQVRN